MGNKRIELSMASAQFLATLEDSCYARVMRAYCAKLSLGVEPSFNDEVARVAYNALMAIEGAIRDALYKEGQREVAVKSAAKRKATTRAVSRSDPSSFVCKESLVEPSRACASLEEPLSVDHVTTTTTTKFKKSSSRLKSDARKKSAVVDSAESALVKIKARSAALGFFISTRTAGAFLNMFSKCENYSEAWLEGSYTVCDCLAERVRSSEYARLSERERTRMYVAAGQGWDDVGSAYAALREKARVKEVGVHGEGARESPAGGALDRRPKECPHCGRAVMWENDGTVLCKAHGVGKYDAELGGYVFDDPHGKESGKFANGFEAFIAARSQRQVA